MCTQYIKSLALGRRSPLAGPAPEASAREEPELSMTRHELGWVGFLELAGGSPGVRFGPGIDHLMYWVPVPLPGWRPAPGPVIFWRPRFRGEVA